MIHQISNSEWPACRGIHFMGIVDVLSADLEAKKKEKRGWVWQGWAEY